MKLAGLVPNSYIHNSVNDLYIPTIGLPILLQEKKWTDRVNLYIAHSYINEKLERRGREASFRGVHKSDFLCSVQTYLYNGNTYSTELVDEI
jgi:hypothetical protein